MSEIDPLENPGWIIRRRHFPVLVGVLVCTLLCVGITGIYAGSTMQASKNDDEVAYLKKENADQKLGYEQRLGKQSAQYAIDATNFGNAVASFSAALERMDVKNDRRAAARERAQAAALIASQKAAQAASVAATKTDQILVKQEETQRQVTATADVAKATEKKIDTVVPATKPAPEPPGRHWYSGGH